MDEGNLKVSDYDNSRKPTHTRSARFGTVFLNSSNVLIDVDAKDILCGFIAELDKRNLVLTDAGDRFEFLMEMYVSNILELTINEPYDLIKSNDVEDLTENTQLYRLMQQYTVYPIYDLYKLNWLEFVNQSWAEIEFQLKMARKFQQDSKVKKDDFEDGENDVVLDESHIVNKATSEVRLKPTFKKHF